MELLKWEDLKGERISFEDLEGEGEGEGDLMWWIHGVPFYSFNSISVVFSSKCQDKESKWITSVRCFQKKKKKEINLKSIFRGCPI